MDRKNRRPGYVVGAVALSIASLFAAGKAYANELLSPLIHPVSRSQEVNLDDFVKGGKAASFHSPNMINLLNEEIAKYKVKVDKNASDKETLSKLENMLVNIRSESGSEFLNYIQSQGRFEKAIQDGVVTTKEMKGINPGVYPVEAVIPDSKVGKQYLFIDVSSANYVKPSKGIESMTEHPYARQQAKPSVESKVTNGTVSSTAPSAENKQKATPSEKAYHPESSQPSEQQSKKQHPYKQSQKTKQSEKPKPKKSKESKKAAKPQKKVRYNPESGPAIIFGGEAGVPLEYSGELGLKWGYIAVVGSVGTRPNITTIDTKKQLMGNLYYVANQKLENFSSWGVSALGYIPLTNHISISLGPSFGIESYTRKDGPNGIADLSDPSNPVYLNTNPDTGKKEPLIKTYDNQKRFELGASIGPNFIIGKKGSKFAVGVNPYFEYKRIWSGGFDLNDFLKGSDEFDGGLRVITYLGRGEVPK